MAELTDEQLARLRAGDTESVVAEVLAANPPPPPWEPPKSWVRDYGVPWGWLDNGYARSIARDVLRSAHDRGMDLVPIPVEHEWTDAEVRSFADAVEDVIDLRQVGARRMLDLLDAAHWRLRAPDLGGDQ